MYQKKQYIQNVILLFTDMLAVICSYFMAAFFWTGFIRKLDVMEFAETKERFGMVLIAFAVVYMVFNTNRKFIERKIFEEFVQCIKLNILFAAAYAIMLFIGDSFDTASRGVYICTVVFNIFLMFFFRILVRIYLVKIYKNHKKTSQLFIITTSGNIENVIDNMKRNVEWTNRISGMAVMDKNFTGRVYHNIPVVAGCDDVLTYIKGQIIDEVFIETDEISNKELSKLVMELENMGTTVHLSFHALDSFNDFNKSLSMLGDIPVLTFANNFYNPWSLAVKRLIDIIGSLVGIAITLIVSIFVAPAILIESRGPLIFKQRRVGKTDVFSMYINSVQCIRMQKNGKKHLWSRMR